MTRYSIQKIKSFLSPTLLQTSASKGDMMEELVLYLFSKVKGLDFYGKDITDSSQSHEMDLVFWNEKKSLHFLDAILIIECKNLNKKVSADQVGWFTKKLSARGLRTGLLISSKGITGRTNKNAHQEILDALTSNGITIILLGVDEIVSLDGPDKLVKLIREKYTKLIVRRRIT